MKKGISVVSLVIVFAIMAIITSVIVISTRDSVDNLNKVKFVTDYISVESAVDKYYSFNGNYPILDKINITFEKNSIDQFEGETITDYTVQLYKLNVEILGIDDLVLGKGNSDKDYYAVSLVTGKIYYVSGFNYNNQVYYKVTKELNENYE